MINTKICELLNIKYPLIQGGMAWVADASLAAAVSKAGALGLIAAGNAPVDYVKKQIRLVKEATDRPFGVNIMLMSPSAEEVAQLVIEEKVQVVTTGAGNPTRFIPAWKEAGIKVIPVVPSCGLAKMVERSGADAVVAEGGEAGGHIGEISTMALIPQVVDAVQIPVIAAGGIFDGRGIAAALILGAGGVQMGTRFLTAYECNIHVNYKKRVLKAKDIDTVVTGRRLGHPVRSLKSIFARDLAAKEQDQTITNEHLEEFAAGSLRLAVQEGDEKKGSFMAGQVVGMCRQEQSCQEIIDEIFGEAEQILGGADKWLK
ncbi:MAG: enoyl-[acyl-carrier-protein] reductase FabK [Bacillota bacterium]